VASMERERRGRGRVLRPGGRGGHHDAVHKLLGCAVCFTARQSLVAHDLPCWGPCPPHAPSLFLLFSPPSLLVLLPLPLSPLQHRNSLFPHAPLLVLPLAFTISQPLYSPHILYPFHLPCLHLFNRLLILVVHQPAVGHKAKIKILVLHRGYPWVIV